MIIFSGSAIQFDFATDGALYQVLKNEGEENIMFTILEALPLGKAISILALIMVFISYLTAADSNISAMSAMSTSGISPEHPEASIVIKLIWGLVIGLIAWVMITSAGVDGIRLLCVIGGFPAMFIILLAAIGTIKLLLTGLK